MKAFAGWAMLGVAGRQTGPAQTRARGGASR
jgi:hypothetical protein